VTQSEQGWDGGFERHRPREGFSTLAFVLLVDVVVWSAGAIAWTWTVLAWAWRATSSGLGFVLLRVAGLLSGVRRAALATGRAGHRGASLVLPRSRLIVLAAWSALWSALTRSRAALRHQLDESAHSRPRQPLALDAHGRRRRASVWAHSGSRPSALNRPRPRARAVNFARVRARARFRATPVLASLPLLALVLAGTFLVGAQASDNYVAQLPDVHALTNNPLPENSLIYTADGSLLADIHDPDGAQHYDESLSRMGKWVPEATVAVEDERFWKGLAVSPAAVARAAYLDWRNGDLRQGGSTITQQLVKLRLTGGSRTYDRKVKEAVLAFQVEGTYTKKQILQMYLNAAPYGNGAQGALAAARSYFGKETRDLDLAEASMLAGIPQSPVYNSPLTNWDGAKARQAQVLQAMLRNGLISRRQADEARAEDLKPLLKQPSPSIHGAPAFARWVIGQLVDRYGRAAAYGGGLKVWTTINPTLQGLAEQAVVNNVNANRSKNMSQGAMVALDPRTGGVVAMVGSADPSRDGGQYNLAVWPPRNPGSSFKIFTYTAAIASQKFTMATHVRDAPLTVATPGSEAWQPKNYDLRYHGTCQVQQCMGNSLNVPAVQVEISTGVDQVVQTARRMGAPPYMPGAQGGYSADVPVGSFGPSLTLGGYPETPLQMATGAATLASGGVYHPPFGIAQVRDREGKVVLAENAQALQAQAQQVLDPRVAYIMQAIMSDDSNRAMIFGSGSALTLPGRHVGAKTGTTEDFKDAWTLGYTPSLASAFWFGNPNSAPMAAGWDAIFAAAPGWHNFMQSALDATHTPDQWYGVPPGLQGGSADGKPVWLMPGTSATQGPPPLPPGASLH
jgi:membrane peptidoglycan carboxypeptidase